MTMFFKKHLLKVLTSTSLPSRVTFVTGETTTASITFCLMNVDISKVTIHAISILAINCSLFTHLIETIPVPVLVLFTVMRGLAV